MSSQLFCYEFFGAIYQDSYSTGCMCTAASGGYTPLRSFFRGISDDLFFQARLGCAGGESRCVGGVPVRSFLWSVFSCIRSGCGDLLRGSPYPVRVLGGGGVRAGGALYLGTFRAVSLGRYFTVHVQALTQRALFLYSLKTSKYSLKTSKSLWLSDVFKKYKKEMRNEKWINV